MDLLRILGFGKAERIETDLDGAKRLLDGEREKRLSPIYPECKRTCEELRGALAEIGKDCGLFEESKAELDPELRSAVKGITKKMRENFIASMRVAVELGTLPGNDYAEFAAFSKGMRERMARIAKINSDNRYIFSFYKEDAERFRKPFERATRLSEALEQKLSERREEAERLERLVSLIGEVEEEGKRVAGLESEAGESVKRLELKRKAMEGFGEAGLKKKQEELESVSAELASVSGSISASITVLERALRKYKKVCDPSEEPERYAEAPLDELLKEGKGYPVLKRVLEGMRKAVETGLIELKNPEKIMSQADWLLAGNLTPMLEKHEELKAKKETIEQELEPLVRKERERQGLETEAVQLEAKLEKQGKMLEDEKASFEKKRAELKEGLREITGKELELKETN